MKSSNSPVSDKIVAPVSTRCLFSFSDGRQCRTPRQPAVAGQFGHPHFCFFHARKEAQARAADEAGREVSGFLSGSYLTACDLSSALARLFAAVAQGQIKPRTAATLAYLGQTLVQTIQLAQDEYINAFSTDGWRRAVRSSFPGQPHEDDDLDQDEAENPEQPTGALLSSPSERAMLKSLESTLAKVYQNK
ncbi:MAG TPA: hypothetical protein VGR03_13505 [Candidatus Acidoferrum sp.]|nr:hypothetical protein [Candidatus Acidoferrum sp.]